MKSVKVTFANGDVINTNINGTDAEICEYYKIGRAFNMGFSTNSDGEAEDNMQKVISCEVLTPKFETGASTHATNDLILFADNTRELAALRDSIFKEFDSNNEVQKERYPLEERFRGLWAQSAIQYQKEFPTSHKHITNMSKGEIVEFCQLYAADFENWKQENKY